MSILFVFTLKWIKFYLQNKIKCQGNPFPFDCFLLNPQIDFQWLLGTCYLLQLEFNIKHCVKGTAAQHCKSVSQRGHKLAASEHRSHLQMCVFDLLRSSQFSPLGIDSFSCLDHAPLCFQALIMFVQLCGWAAGKKK